MRFHEEQRFRGGWRWFWAAVIAGPWLAVVVVLLVVFSGSDDLRTVLIVLALTGLLDLVLLALLLRQRMIVEVDEERVRIRVSPFMREEVAAGEIERIETIESGLWRTYGAGFGKRWGDRRVRLTVGNDTGVRLTKTDGWTVVIGSERPEELAEAIRDIVFAHRPDLRERYEEQRWGRGVAS